VTAHRDHVPLRDHWWPRPGWRPGRIALTWHLIFPDCPALAEHAAAYQRALDGGQVTPKVQTGFTIITKDNVDGDAASAVYKSSC